VKQIQYAGAAFQVGDAVADALVAYAAGLSSRGRTDSVALPVLASDGRATVVTLLLNSSTSLVVTGAAGPLPGLDENAVAADLDTRRQWLDTIPAVVPQESAVPEDLIWLEFPEVAAMMQESGVEPQHHAGRAPVGAPAIFTVVYVSTLEDSLGSAEIRSLLETSRSHNTARGISGMLVFRGRRVMQLLEGAEDDVRGLYSRILADPRHEDVVTVWTSVHEQRRFPDWSMGFDELEIPSDRPLVRGWPEPDLAAISPSSPGGGSDEFLLRRSEALHRALVTADPLVASLALILHGHRPENVLDGDRVIRRQCAECRPHAALDAYPCSTAKNAIEALEAA
jgi:hypothetical protein